MSLLLQESTPDDILKLIKVLEQSYIIQSMDETHVQEFYLPEDILLEILFKLPPICLIRFKCVAKKWLFLISEPLFFRFYVSRSHRSPPFRFIFQCDNRMEVHLFGPDHERSLMKLINSRFPYDEAESVKVEATCSDLVLYRSSPDDEYFVDNPFTRQFVKLPIHSREKRCGSAGFVSCVRNGVASYNIARPVKDVDMNVKINTFCSRTGEWRSFKPKICTYGFKFDNSPCIVYKEALHWICNKMKHVLVYDPCNSPDECQLINVPNAVYRRNGMNAILGVSDGNLRYFEMSSIGIHANKLPGWKLWLLKDYNAGEWILDREGTERDIDPFSVLCSTVLSTHSPLIPIAFHPCDKDKIYFWHESNVLSFNCKTGWFEDEFCRLSSDSMISTWAIFPLLIPFSPSKLEEHHKDECRHIGALPS